MEKFYLLVDDSISEKEIVNLISASFESSFDRKLKKQKIDESFKGPTEKIGLDYFHWAFHKKDEIFIGLFPNTGHDKRQFIKGYPKNWILRFYLNNNWSDPNASLLIVEEFLNELPIEYKLLQSDEYD